jgi:hypothetical protein
MEWVVRMRETVERVYTVTAETEDEARAKVEAFDGDLSHEDGVVDWAIVSCEPMGIE